MASSVSSQGCPIDLDNAFALQQTTENLKGVLNWIITGLGEAQKNVAENTSDIAHIKQEIKELEAKNIEDVDTKVNSMKEVATDDRKQINEGFQQLNQSVQESVQALNNKVQGQIIHLTNAVKNIADFQS